MFFLEMLLIFLFIKKKCKCIFEIFYYLSVFIIFYGEWLLWNVFIDNMFFLRIYISKYDCDNDWIVLLVIIFKIEFRCKKKFERYLYICIVRVSYD